MPELLARPFAAVGERARRLADAAAPRPGLPGAVRRRLDASTCAPTPTTWPRRSRQVCGGRDAAGYRRLVAYLRELYDIEHADFIDRNLDSPLQLLGPPLRGWSRWAASAGSRRKVGQYFADARLRRIFSFQAMYAGLAPHDALAIYAVITYMDCVRRRVLPATAACTRCPRALAARGARSTACAFRYGTTVAGSRSPAAGPRGVHTDRRRAHPGRRGASCNADLPTAYRELLPPGSAPRRVRAAALLAVVRVVLHAGSPAGYPDDSRTTRSTSGGRGTRRSRRSSTGAG